MSKKVHKNTKYCSFKKFVMFRCLKNVKCTPGILISLGSTPGKSYPRVPQGFATLPWGTLGYWQISSKLRNCATPGTLAKIPGGTPGKWP
jgi:hypothetical protein